MKCLRSKKRKNALHITTEAPRQDTAPSRVLLGTTNKTRSVSPGMLSISVAFLLVPGATSETAGTQSYYGWERILRHMRPRAMCGDFFFQNRVAFFFKIM